MVKINLVPLKEKKKQQEYVFILAGITAGMILVFVLFWVYIQKIQVERDLNAQITKVDNESKGYQGKIAEVNAFQATQQELDATNTILQGIQTIQKNVVFALDQIALNLPKGVWLTGVTQNPKDENSYLVDGCAFSLTGVQAYYQSLTDTEGLSKDSTLDIKSDAAVVGIDHLIEFEINLKLTADKKS